MENEERNRSSKSYERFRATLHLGMGTFYILIGIVVFYVKKFGRMELSDGWAYGISAFCLLYGIFRIWRGFADTKALNRERKR